MPLPGLVDAAACALLRRNITRVAHIVLADSVIAVAGARALCRHKSRRRRIKARLRCITSCWLGVAPLAQQTITLLLGIAWRASRRRLPRRRSIETRHALFAGYQFRQRRYAPRRRIGVVAAANGGGRGEASNASARRTRGAAALGHGAATKTSAARVRAAASTSRYAHFHKRAGAQQRRAAGAASMRAARWTHALAARLDIFLPAQDDAPPRFLAAWRRRQRLAPGANSFGWTGWCRTALAHHRAPHAHAPRAYLLQRFCGILSTRAFSHSGFLARKMDREENVGVAR